MTLHTVFFALFTVLHLACILAVIFVERKNPASTIAWTMVLFFLPFIGFAAYLMFGSGFHVSQKRRFAVKQISDTIYRKILSRYIEGCGACSRNQDAPHERMIRYMENDGEYYSGDNNARIFTNGNTLFAAMLDDMRRAKKHIHLLYYIFRHDELGKEILSILTQKAAQGVDVRVIYDSVGSMISRGRVFRELQAAGGQVQAFSPLFSSLFSSGAFSSHLRLNYRNHRKITVIDGVVGYVGGMNIGDEYLGKSRLSPWRDTHLRLTGTTVSFLQERFLFDWTGIVGIDLAPAEIQSFFPQPLQQGRLGVQIVSSGPDVPGSAIKSGLLEMVYMARRNVFIQTPYFTPDDSLFDALRIAAKSGVDVRLMIPAMMDHPFVHCATYSYAHQVLEAGVKVYRYKGFLHAKTTVVDGQVATIGTANFDNRSFSLNFEINAFIYNEDFAAECEQIFLQDQENCLEYTDEWYRKRPAIVRGAYSLSRLFAPLI